MIHWWNITCTINHLPICVSTVHSLVTEQHKTTHCDSVLLKEMEKHEVFVGNGIEFQWRTLERFHGSTLLRRLVPPDSYSASKLSYTASCIQRNLRTFAIMNPVHRYDHTISIKLQSCFLSNWFFKLSIKKFWVNTIFYLWMPLFWYNSENYCLKFYSYYHFYTYVMKINLSFRKSNYYSPTQEAELEAF